MEMGRVTELLATVAGGGAAGYLDQKYAKKIGGLSVGTLAGLATAGLGMTRLSGKFSSKLLALGEGMLAGEAYRMASNRTAPGSVSLPQDTTAAAAGVRGLRAVGGTGALPAPRRVMSDSELQSAIMSLRA